MKGPEPTTGGLFIGLVVGVIVIVGGLTFFPALALGPIVEHLLMGEISPALLEMMRIPHRVLSAATIAEDVAWGRAESDRLSQPVALLLPPGGQEVAMIVPLPSSCARNLASDFVEALKRYRPFRTPSRMLPSGGIAGIGSGSFVTVR